MKVESESVLRAVEWRSR